MPLEEFEKYINRIREVDAFQDELRNVCYKFCKDNKMGEEADIWMPTLVCSVVELLEKLMGSNSDWIGYWIWELKYGEEYEDGCITDENGKIIKLKTVEDLYNLLLSLN